MPGLLFRLADLPDALRAQAVRQLEADNAAQKRRVAPSAADTQYSAAKPKRRAKGNGNPDSSADKPIHSDSQAYCELVPWNPTSIEPPPLRFERDAKMTATEKLYLSSVLKGAGRFEPMTLHLPGGGRYTPDFLTFEDGIPTLTEVKGSYRLGSQGRAFTAFHEAAAAFPFFRFVWAEKNKDGSFKTKTLPALPRPLSPATKE